MDKVMIEPAWLICFAAQARGKMEINFHLGSNEASAGYCNMQLVTPPGQLSHWVSAQYPSLFLSN